MSSISMFESSSVVHLKKTTSSTTISYFDKLSPTAQTFLRRVVGVGVSLYIARVIFISPEFKHAFSKLNFWQTSTSDLCIFAKQNPYERSKSSKLLELPGNVRRFIWSKLSFADLKIIRLVCKRFQWDVDYAVGIHALVDSRATKSFNWYKTIAIRKCTVQHLTDIDDWSFLGKPKIIRILRINNICVITPKTLGIILQRCTSLQNLSIHFRDDGYSNDKTNILIFELLEGKENQNRRFPLIFLHVTYIPSYRTCHWDMKFGKSVRIPKVIMDKEDLEEIESILTDPRSSVIPTENNNNESCTDLYSDLTFPSSTKYLHLEFEHYTGFDGLSYSNNRFFWNMFLRAQKNLKVIVCNFGPVCWDIYAQIIKRNSNTLEKIYLNNVTCWNFWEDIQEGETPFDWNFFAICPKLLYLSVITDSGPKFGPTLYTPMRPVYMQLRVLHCNFGLVFWGIYTSIVAVNVNTLDDISLLRMTNWDKENSVESAFDWNIFSQCKVLRSLIIGGEHLTFLETINFESIIIQKLTTFQLYWVSLTSENVSHMIKYMPDLENTFEFLDWCSIDKVYKRDEAKSIVNKYRHCWNESFLYSSISNVKRVISVLPLAEIAATTWLLWVKPDV